MPTTATAPSPLIHAQAAARSAGEQGRSVRSHSGYRDAPVEERVAVLEARWEETVPTLATSKDISDLRGGLRGEMRELRGELKGEMSELRGEMRNLENRLLRWGVGAVLALLAVLAATFAANTARIDSLAARMEQNTARLDARMDALDAKLDARFDALMAELRASRGR